MMSLHCELRLLICNLQGTNKILSRRKTGNYVLRWLYFLKIKYTARTRKVKPIRWFSRKVSVLKKTRENRVNTSSVITSWITFSSTSENGPPFSLYPKRFAGTWKQYSKKAIPQLMTMIAKSPALSNQRHSLNFRWPY